MYRNHPGEMFLGEGRVREPAVVVTVTVAVAMFDPSRAVEDGRTAQDAAFGAPAQPSVTASRNPPEGIKLIANVAAWPAAILRVAGEAEIEKSAPIPDKATTATSCGRLLVKVNDPVLVPAAVGLKTTRIAQACRAERPPSQVLVCVKSPLTSMLVKSKYASTELASVTV